TSGAGHQKIAISDAFPHRDQGLQSLDRFQSPNEEKIGPFLRTRAGVLPIAVGALGEIWQMSDRLRETALGVHARSEATGRDESVNALARSRQQVRVTPELRRAFSGERAAKTLRLFAPPGGGLPKHLRRAGQPRFVRRVEVYGRRTPRDPPSKILARAGENYE